MDQEPHPTGRTGSSLLDRLGRLAPGLGGVVGFRVEEIGQDLVRGRALGNHANHGCHRQPQAKNTATPPSTSGSDAIHPTSDPSTTTTERSATLANAS